MSHFYDRRGSPCHTQPTKPGAKNATRPTTIADAKRLGLLPSVSTITKVFHAPGLETYKMREVAKACFGNPPHPGEEMAPYVQAMVEKSSEDASRAAELGTQIHAALEAHFTGEKPAIESYVIGGREYHVDTFIQPAIRLIEEKGWTIVAAERVLVNEKEGYAGTTDLIIKTREGLGGIADFKTKRTKPGKPVEPSETHPCQIAAYWAAQWWVNGETTPYGANIFISTTEPGRVELIKYDAITLWNGWRAFLNMRDLWCWSSNYLPTSHYWPTAHGETRGT